MAIYKVHREGHNLDRCRTQFKLVESIEQQEAAMDRFIARHLEGDRSSPHFFLAILLCQTSSFC